MSELDLSPQLPNYDARAEILEFEKRMILDIPEGPSNEPIVRVGYVNGHQFCPGVYARSIFMPAGTYLSSKIHKTQHFFAVLQGSCTVRDSHGITTEIAAPYLGVTMPGTKRLLRIHEDCIWVTFHPTTLTDVDEIEREILAESFDEIDAMEKPQ